ncbi:uncharacterized protein LOC133987773 [Scomber scombrus]|uniref:uncharacterized protein LOC133987773 n=1 Tax=Scomber scombrus TaxID=13677 RepID=UPI002DDAE2DD|nr:uncharacterized protein LOC133987773 [Scomber scombrus]
MNIHQVLFFCFLSALQDGDTGLSNAIQLYAGAEGGSGSLTYSFTSSGNTKFFCKGECKEENILIKTDDVTAQSGRYSIKYKDGSSGTRSVTVTITQLTKSDAGRYRYGLGGSLFPDSYSDFDLIVTDEAPLGENTRFIPAETEGGNVTRECIGTDYGTRKFFCKDECKKEEDNLVETKGNKAEIDRYSIKYTKVSEYGLYVTITQLKKSDSGWYKCGYRRPSSTDSSYSFPIFVIDAPTTEEPNWTLRPFPTSVPSASTPATTQSLISSSGSFTPSSSFPETTEQSAETEGGNVTRVCNAAVHGSMKFFCKDECKKEEDILVETAENTALNGRYSIKYIEGSGMYVTITQLEKSDTGRYKCGYGRALSPDSFDWFPIIVVDAVSGVSLPSYFWPLVASMSLIIVMVAVVLLFVYKLMTRRNSGLNTRETSDSRNMELSVVYVHYENRPPVHYKNRPPVSMSEDPVYQSLDAAGMDPDQTYSALRETTNK